MKINLRVAFLALLFLTIGSSQAFAQSAKVSIIFVGGTPAIKQMACRNVTILPDSHDNAGATSVRKKQHGAIKIVREVDQASPLLMKASTDGTGIKEMRIDMQRNGTTIKKMTVTDAVITGIQRIEGGSSTAKPEEEISFTYQKIEWH